jgi:hypothetical protein
MAAYDSAATATALPLDGPGKVAATSGVASGDTSPDGDAGEEKNSPLSLAVEFAAG